MAYGVISTTVLLTLGMTPAAASAAVHSAEVFTTAVAGASHAAAGNVDWRIVRGLALPAVIGGILGAYILTSFDANMVRPWVAAYLLIMGARILWRAARPPSGHRPRRLALLGFIGGLLDASGGGGWGGVVTTTLLASGSVPHRVIGSVALTEFFLSLAVSGAFIGRIGFQYYDVVLGLLIGGIIAAPFAAFFAKRVPGKYLMALVGILIMVLSARTLLAAFL
jgi:uncharacterized membrane protein YfcA